MKKTILLLFMATAGIVSAQQESIGIIGNENWMQNWTNFKPKTTAYRDADIILSGKISSNKVLEKKHTYAIVGSVYVTDNATLTIEPGTVLRGDYATDGTLIITKGAKIIAKGTEVNPIVFTSSKGVSDRNSGDWGGIILLGNAPINRLGGAAVLDFNLDPAHTTYGGDNIESDSGVLEYVRIEFSGRKINSFKELNGLSLAGVGQKTKIENIQVSFSNDDSFECYGGNVKMTNLVSFKATDDDFDFTQGVQAKISNSAAIRYPFYSDVSKSRCFEIDSYDKIDNTDFAKKMTTVEATNMTFVNIDTNDQGLVKEAVYIKENSFLTIKNSFVSGFSTMALLDFKGQNKELNLKKIFFKNIIVNNCPVLFSTESETEKYMLTDFMETQVSKITSIKKNLADMVNSADFKYEIDLRLQQNQVLTVR